MDFPLACGPDAPHEPCTCGIYAAKNLEHFFDIGYMKRGDIHGEVFLWGKVFDHSLGYRAQFAYPKKIVLPHESIPKADDVESHLEPLIAYSVDIFILTPTPDIAMAPVVISQDIPLWTRASGYNEEGFGWIRRREWHWRSKCLPSP